MVGGKMAVAKRISELGKATRFGPFWPGKRCLAKPVKVLLASVPLSNTIADAERMAASQQAPKQ